MSEAPSSERATSGRTELLLLGLCLAFALGAFLPSLSFELVSWDDNLYLYENPLVIGGAPVTLRERLLTPSLDYPVPVTILTYTLEHALFGLAPWIYHATNLALHLGCCALLFRLARRLGLGAVGAAVATLIFGVHPVVAEPVSWVTGRKDLLALLFALGAAYDFLRHPFELRLRRSWLAPLLFALALLSKPVAVFLVPLLFAWHLGLRRQGARRAAWAVAPMAVVAVAWLPLALAVQRDTLDSGGARSLGALLREAWYALGFHLGLLAFVREPCAKYLPSWPPRFDPLVDLMPVAWAIGCALLLWATPRAHRRLALAGLAWAVLAFLPTANLIQLTRFLADSYLYAPLAGLGLMLGAAVQGVAQPPSRKAWLTTAGGLIVLGTLLGAQALPASLRFRDSVTLWEHAASQYPDDYRLCRNHANALFAQKRLELALVRYQICAERFGAQHFERNIAVTLFTLGRRAEAKQRFLALRQRTPDDPVVQKYLRLLE